MISQKISISLCLVDASRLQARPRNEGTSAVGAPDGVHVNPAKKGITLIIACALLTINSIAYAEEKLQTIMPSRLNLAQAIRLAYENNPVINEAREKIVEQDGRLMSTESALLPNIGAYGLYQWDEEERLGGFGGPDSAAPDQEFWRAGVDLTQPLYSGGLLNATVRARRFETAALQSEVIAAQSRILANVHRNFFGAMLAREVVVVQKESIKLLDQQLSLASNRYAAGAGARFDVLQAEVRLANAQPTLIRAQNNYRIAIDQLRTSLGAVYGPESHPDAIELEGSLTGGNGLMALDVALAEAMDNRPELVALARRRDAAEQDVRRARAQRSPSVDLFANYGLEHDRNDPDGDPLQGFEAGVQARLSLWEGGRIKGEVAQAKSRFEQAKLREQAARLNAELEVRNAWNKAHEAEQILTAAEFVIKQAEEALRLAENRYSVGAITQLDVLSSQLEFTQAKLNQVTALHDYHVALVELEQAVGRIPGRDFLAAD